jgi:hypothetical protein
MWSPELNAKLLELVQTKVAIYDSYISEMEQMPVDEAYLVHHSRSWGSRPIRVLSTGKHGVHALDPTRPLDPEQQKYQQEVEREQARWLELSSNSKQLFSDKCSEYIPFDQPSLVVDAIRDGVHAEQVERNTGSPKRTFLVEHLRGAVRTQELEFPKETLAVVALGSRLCKNRSRPRRKSILLNSNFEISQN